VGVGLHARCLSNDPTAPADVCAWYLSALVGWLASAFRGSDEHHFQTAAENAVLAYLRHPERYQPGRADLGRYLRVVARRGVLNLLRGDRRWRRKKVRLSVAETGPAGNLLRSKDDPAHGLEVEEQAGERARLVAHVEQGFTPEERAVLNLMRSGEKRLEVYVAALGMGERGEAEQRRAVKRVRDRVLKRLQRGGKKHG
jgi:RNA polymerase sigma-70 factor (ECF subfamily)